MDFQFFIALLIPYWGLITVVLGFVVYGLFQRENAKKIILSLMLRLEKEAESLALETGDAKLQFMLDKGYQLLPAGVRMFISESTFDELATSLYNKAKSYLIVQKVSQIIPVSNANVDTSTITHESVLPALEVSNDEFPVFTEILSNPETVATPTIEPLTEITQENQNSVEILPDPLIMQTLNIPAIQENIKQQIALQITDIAQATAVNAVADIIKQSVESVVK